MSYGESYLGDKMAWGGRFLARIRGKMDPKSGFDEDVLFTVGKTEFQEKCPRVDVCTQLAGERQGSGDRRCFGDGMK